MKHIEKWSLFLGPQNPFLRQFSNAFKFSFSNLISFCNYIRFLLFLQYFNCFFINLMGIIIM